MPKGINPKTGRSYRFKDRTGTRNGRLVFLRTLGEDAHRHHVWEAQCDCGNITQTATPHNTKSCGCLQKEVMAAKQRAKRLPEAERKRRYRENAARQRERRKTIPEKAMQARISRLHRWALHQVGGVKRSPTLEALGYSASQLVEHIERQFLPGMGWHNMTDWQIDHIIPVSEAKSEDDVIALNQLANLRPLWADDNNRKKNRRELLL